MGEFKLNVELTFTTATLLLNIALVHAQKNGEVVGDSDLESIIASGLNLIGRMTTDEQRVIFARPLKSAIGTPETIVKMFREDYPNLFE